MFLFTVIFLLVLPALNVSTLDDVNNGATSVILVSAPVRLGLIWVLNWLWGQGLKIITLT